MSRKLVEHPSCAICAENYDEEKRIPKCLPCFHTFCALCLEDLTKGKTTIECPNCRQTSSVPEKGVSGLVSNFALLDVVGDSEVSASEVPKVDEKRVTVRVSIPEEIEQGVINITLAPDAKVSSLLQSLVGDLQIRLGSSFTLDSENFGLSRKPISSDELIDEKLLLADDVKVDDCSLTVTKDGALLAYLINLTGQRRPTSDSEKWAKDREDRAKRERERLSGKDTSASPKRTTDPWADSVVLDLDGKEVKIANRWVKNRAVLCLVRRFGCALCHHQSILLMQLKPKLDQIGVPLIIVGNGPTKAGVKYKSGLKWSGDVFTDPESKMYKLMALPRLSAWQAMKRFLGTRVIKLFKQLSKQYTSSDAEGDGQQTGGVFVVGPGAGRPIRYSYIENDNEPDNFADIDSVLYAAGWTPDMVLKES